ncbi:MAG: hypothetical protein KAS32_19275 [Candidatus Peribacteraceae bacterium]|nr:hypothetical protein [Candidatus Peribacteraceae bacterium]
MGVSWHQKATRLSLKAFCDVLGFQDQYITSSITILDFANRVNRLMNPSLAHALAILIHALRKGDERVEYLLGRVCSDLARGNAKALGYYDWDDEHGDEIEKVVYVLLTPREDGTFPRYYDIFRTHKNYFFNNLKDAVKAGKKRMRHHSYDPVGGVAVFKAFVYFSNKKEDVNWGLGISPYGKFH